MQLEAQAFVDFLGDGIPVEASRTPISKVLQIIGFQLQAIELVDATEVLHLLLGLFPRADLLAVLVARELIEELLVREALVVSLFGAKARGDGEVGHDRTVVDAVGLHLLQYFHRIGERLGHIGEDVVHLGLRLEPLLLGVAHALRVIEILGCAQADETVVGFCILLINEVYVVGTHYLHAVLLGQLQDDLVSLLLQGECLAVGQLRGIFHFMALDLEVVVLAKDVLVPQDGFLSPLDIAIEDAAWHLAGDAGRADDQSLVVFFQLMMVGTRSRIETLDP